jgi:hypothetical protein
MARPTPSPAGAPPPALHRKALRHLSENGVRSLLAKSAGFVGRKARKAFDGIVLAPIERMLLKSAAAAPARRYIRRLNDAIAAADRADPFVRIDDRVLFANLQYHEPSLLPAAFAGRQPYILTDRACGEEVRQKLGPVLRSLDGLSPEQISRGVFYVYFLCDDDALVSIRRIRKHGGTYVPHLDYGKTSYRFINPLARAAMQKTWAMGERVSHLNLAVHENLCEAIWATRELEGDYVEIGVYLGGSALTALHLFDALAAAGLLRHARKAWLLDTYDGFTYEEAQASADAIWAGTHALFGREKTMAHLEQTFAHTRTPRELVACNICRDPLPAGAGKIAVANIDVDMYEPTLDALNKVATRVVPGGIIICEDPASTPALYGALLAMEDFLASKQGAPFCRFFKGGQYFLAKIR